MSFKPRLVGSLGAITVSFLFSTPAIAVDRHFEAFDEGVPDLWALHYGSIDTLETMNGKALLLGDLYSDPDSAVKWSIDFSQPGHLRFDIRPVENSVCCSSLDINVPALSSYQSFDGTDWQTVDFEVSAGLFEMGIVFSGSSSGSRYALIDNVRYLGADLDADGDLVADEWENTHGLDSTDALDGELDSDSDGVTNEQEYWLGLDPNLGDTDSDGMSDGYERLYGFNPNDDADGSIDSDEDGLTNAEESSHGTSPLVRDTDGDGLEDAYEIQTTGTSPIKKDGDGDGYSDGFEIQKGTDPDNGADFPGAIKKLDIGFESELGAEWEHLSEFHQWSRVEVPTYQGRHALKTNVSPFYPESRIRLTQNFDQGHLQFRSKVAGRDSTSGVVSVQVSGQSVDHGSYSYQSDGWTVRTVEINQGRHEVTFIADKYYSVDTDDDILIDAIRFLSITDDNDGDLMDDDWEKQYQLNPATANDASSDPDSDQISNQDEFWVGTNPQSADTDGDGIDDAWELKFESNPKDETDASQDVDGDGLTALEEFQNGSSPILSDTDADGVSDYDEVKTHQTDPAMSDTDQDGLSDRDEIETTNTDPILFDSDNDGFSDGGELTLSTDPMDIQSFPARISEVREVYTEQTSSVWEPVAGNGPEWGQMPVPDHYYHNQGYGVGLASNQSTSIEWTGYFEKGRLYVSPDTEDVGMSILVDGEPVHEPSSCCNSLYTIPLNEGGHSIRITVESDEYGSTHQFVLNYTLYLPDSVDQNTNRVRDSWESQYNFSSYDVRYDADNDDLTTRLEFLHGTEPRIEDTDGDNVPDGVEYRFGLNPSVASDGQDDLDDDGLSNSDEYVYGARIDRQDTDHDGLLDGEEVSTYLTDPTVDDSDGDGIADGTEVDTHRTDPAKSDTDSDSFSDQIELALATDPLDDTSKPEVVRERLFSFEAGLSDDWNVVSGSFLTTNDTRSHGDRGLTVDRYWNTATLDGYFVDSIARVYIDPGQGSVRMESLNDSVQANNGPGYYDLFIEAGRNTITLDLRGNSADHPVVDELRISPADSDGDGLPDFWEISQGLNPQNDQDALQDSDGDGLSRLEEFQWGTADNQSDTDNDGLNDFWEVTYGTKALVPDASHDTDEDGLTHLQELTNATHPLMADTDQDGMDDAWELDHGTHPLQEDGALDLDEDGLTNLAEFKHALDPAQADSDDDGLPDGWEVRYETRHNEPDASADPDGDGRTNISELEDGTHPNRRDTDDDGIPDGWEYDNGLNGLRAFDAELDYDDDGFTNLQEFANNTDPHRADGGASNGGVLLGLGWLTALLILCRIRRCSEARPV